MNFPPFWAKGVSNEVECGDRRLKLECWRWSQKSLEEARQLARAAVEKLREHCAASGELPRHYGYADRPLREPVLLRLSNPEGDVSAVVTRNSYGCQVLNTARVFFLDVDFSSQSDSPGLLARLFRGKSKPAEESAALLQLAQRWVRQNPDWGLRLYRTKAGVRLMATHDLFDPELVADNPVWSASWKADPLFLRLCKTQKCFRARLTPKPWRCQLPRPPARWPFNNVQQERQFQDWLRQYETACRSFSVCRLLETLGNTRLHPEVEPILRAHDEATGALGSLPLA